MDQWTIESLNKMYLVQNLIQNMSRNKEAIQKFRSVMAGELLIYFMTFKMDCLVILYYVGFHV